MTGDTVGYLHTKRGLNFCVCRLLYSTVNGISSLVCTYFNVNSSKRYLHVTKNKNIQTHIGPIVLFRIRRRQVTDNTDL